MLTEILSAIPTGIIILEQDRRILFSNKKARELLGPEEHVSDTLDIPKHTGKSPDSGCRMLIDRVFQALNDEAAGSEVSFDHEIKNSSGSRLLFVTAVLSENKKYQGPLLVVTLEDMTKERQREDELRDSEEMYRTMFEHAGFGIALVDPETRKRVAFNRKLHERLGYTREEYKNLALEDIVYGHEKKAVKKRMESIFSNRAETFEEIQQKKNGDICHIMVSAVPIKIRGRDLVHAISIDITDRKKMEEDLKAKTEELDQYFNNSMDLLCIADIEGRFHRFNPRWEELLGFSPAELMDKQVLSFVHPDDYPDVQDAWALLKSSGGGQTFTCRYRCRDGSYKWLQWQAYSDKCFINAAARDITLQHTLEEQLRQAQKMEAIGRLAGGVAHDFNNMLNVILGYTELGMSEIKDESRLLSCFKEIETAAARSADLTRQLLAFSRKQMVSPRIIQLDDVIAGQKNLLARLMGEEIAIHITSDRDLWMVKMDPTQIHQILVNLVVNAKDAIAGVGTLEIETLNLSLQESRSLAHPRPDPGEYVLLTVKDTGCGISKGNMGYIFEPFFTTKEAGKGTGLGLSTVYGIVKQNKGWIDVESRENKGTCFKVYLPRYKGDGPADEIKDDSEPLATGSETILVVEDEPQLLALVKEILESYGYKVLEAGSPGEAIHTAKQHNNEIHLMITDVIMPEMNGKKLMEMIAKIKPDIQVLYMSGYAADYIAARGMIDRHVNFIQKPFTMDALAGKIRQIFEG